MRRSFNAIVEHAHWIVVIGFILCVMLAVILGVTTQAGCTNVSFGQGLETSLSILMTLETPKSSLASSGIPIRILGWVVAFFGWLTIPALLGVVISRTAVAALREKELKFAITSMTRDLQGDEQAAAKLIEAMLKFEDELLRGAGSTIDASKDARKTNKPE